MQRTPQSPALTFLDSSGGPSVVLQSPAVQLLDRYRQRRFWQREAGGQLFARFDGAHTYVEIATEPSRRDLRSRFGFRPHQPTQKREIRRYFDAGLHFVGDWHSHPEDEPTPSSIDLESIRDCFERSKHDLKALLLVIVGRGDAPSGLWVGLVTRYTVRPLHMQN